MTVMRFSLKINLLYEIKGCWIDLVAFGCIALCTSCAWRLSFHQRKYLLKRLLALVKVFLLTMCNLLHPHVFWMCKACLLSFSISYEASRSPKHRWLACLKVLKTSGASMASNCRCSSLGFPQSNKFLHMWRMRGPICI